MPLALDHIASLQGNRPRRMKLGNWASNGNDPFDLEDIREIAAAVARNHELRELDLEGNELDDEDIELLAPALKANPSIEVINLCKNEISDRGFSLLAEALEAHPSLIKLDVSENAVSAQGIASLAPILHSEMLAELRAIQKTFTGLHAAALSEIRKELTKGAPPLMDAIEARASCNVINVSPMSDPIRIDISRQMRENGQEAEFVRNQLTQTLGSGWSLSLIARAAARRGALVSKYDPDDIITELDETIADMPFPSDLTPASVTAKDPESGLSCLDNPKFWRGFETSGVTLGKDALMAANRDNEPAMVTGIHMGRTTQILEHLNAQEAFIATNDLLTDDGDYTPLLQALLEENAVPLLFTLENWEDQSRADLTRFFHALPEEVQDEISNYHTLSSSLSRAQATARHIG